MSYTKIKYPKREADRAGLAVINSKASALELRQSKKIIDNWRASHNFPLLVFRMNLSKKAKNIGGGLIAQRIKRFRAIKNKLTWMSESKKFKKLRLSDLQDIGGCRVVLDTVAKAEAVVAALRSSKINRNLVNEDDYIANPKASTGYRSCHLIYRYKATTPKNRSYDGLKIEIQIRSQLQHIWATAVESVDTYQHQKLKLNRGNADWRDFFKLMSSYLALREGRVPVPGTPKTKTELKKEIRRYVNQLDIIASLNNIRTYGQALKEKGKNLNKKKPFLVLKLDTHGKTPTLEIFAYSVEQQEAAELKLSELEKEAEANEYIDAVLISLEEVGSLHKAYPNYFLDIVRFIELVKLAIK